MITRNNKITDGGKITIEFAQMNPYLLCTNKKVLLTQMKESMTNVLEQLLILNFLKDFVTVLQIQVMNHDLLLLCV